VPAATAFDACSAGQQIDCVPVVHTGVVVVVVIGDVGIVDVVIGIDVFFVADSFASPHAS
jgi:hypothetical protein